MMNAFGTYIKTIATFLIFATVISIIVPEGKLKKYIDLVIGIILVAVLISPLSNLLSGGEMVEAQIFDGFYEYQQNSLAVNKEYYEDKQLEAIMDQYKIDLCKNAANYVYQRTGINIRRSEVVINENKDDDNYGVIESFSTNIIVLDYESDSERDAFLKKIALGNGYDIESNVFDENELILLVKNCLKDFYNLQEGNIYITVQMKNQGDDTNG